MLGKLVAVNGMVVRASSVNPICVAMEFKCRKCFGVMTHPQTDGMYQLPSHCYAGKDQFVICRGKKFEPLKSSPKTKTIEWQSVRIQENGNDNLVLLLIFRSHK
jgi:DNA replicative helicase MCM subunit Mcm2 (Cdc46/Mcm family)